MECKHIFWSVKMFQGPCGWRNVPSTTPTGLWWGNLRERDHLGDPGLDGKIIIRWLFRKWKEGTWTGSRWLRIGTSGGHL